MERIVIPGRATYSPVALTDLIVGAPMASRLLLGATAPGQLIAAASMGAYAGSAARDWYARRHVRPIDFQAAFGVDVDTLEPMPLTARRAELPLSGRALNEGYTARRSARDEVAVRADRHLTAFIASITGQEIVTSTEVRSFNLSRVLMPSALGTCDVISGDIAIFTDTPGLMPHVIAHEFCHRKGYLKELHAQALSWFALRHSGDDELVQAARIERLYRQIRTIQRVDPQSPTGSQLLAEAGLRPEVLELVMPGGSARCASWSTPGCG